MLQDWLRPRWSRPAVKAPSAAGDDTAGAQAVPAAAPPQDTRVPCLSSATRDYDRAIASGIFDRASAHELSRLYAGMGADVWAWQYAKRLTSQSPWRASPNLADAAERIRATQLMLADIATWERALAALDVAGDRARLYGTPPPVPIELPAAVKALIEARRAAALERVTRRRPPAGEGGAGPTFRPDDAARHPPLPRTPI